jgi:uncharacterized protein with PIN domain
MVIDTSALVAIALWEPSRQRLLDALEAAAGRIISSVSLLEAGMVLRARSGETALPWLCQLVEELGVRLSPLMKSRRDWQSQRLGALERGWATGRNSTSEIVPCTPWPHHALSPCWQRAMISRQPI